MPQITKQVHVWSAREVLFARCAHCGFILNWVNDRKSDGTKRAATCCDLSYLCEVSSDAPPHFVVETFEIDMTNVVILF
jgi:hypothetical protein